MDATIVKAGEDVSQPEGLDIERARQGFQEMVRDVPLVPEWQLPALTGERVFAVFRLIPKGGDASYSGAQPPGKLRPISVLPQLARVWSQFRFEDIMEKILPSVLGCQHGGLPRRQARSIAARLLVRMDSATRSRQRGGRGHFCFAQLDLRKYFNCIDVCAVESLWIRLGMPADFARLLTSHYSQMVVRTRFHFV
eukprot:3784009-Amphidinium_carterae.2